jgi:Cof subfamily protein (haloacid dehalogenase superfamily)
MLIATDLDGTLLRNDKTISPFTADVLSRVDAAGTPIVLVTGRPIRWLAHVYGQLHTPLPAVCANGAVVYDPVADRVLRTDPLEPSVLAEVAKRLRDEVPDVQLAVEIADGREMRHDPTYPVEAGFEQAMVRAIETPEDLVSMPAVKLLVRAGKRDPDAFAALVGGAVAGLAEATHSSYTGLVEVSAAGVTKAAGLAWFCHRAGIDGSTVVAFGDMPNDVPMLTWAGKSLAVGNAHPAVREIADEVIGSNEADGVAHYLDALQARRNTA